MSQDFVLNLTVLISRADMAQPDGGIQFPPRSLVPFGFVQLAFLEILAVVRSDHG